MCDIGELSIRRASAADAPALKLLIEASVRELQAAEYAPAELDGALGHALGLDSQLIEDGTYFVAETPTGEIVGSGGWSYRKTLCGSDHLLDRDTERLDPMKDAARIRGIYVHPGWARRGLGSRMLEYCEREAGAAGFRRLEMGSTLTGVPLYRLRGYQEVERSAIALPNGSSYIVVRMNKSL